MYFKNSLIQNDYFTTYKSRKVVPDAANPLKIFVVLRFESRDQNGLGRLRRRRRRERHWASSERRGTSFVVTVKRLFLFNQL